MSLFDRTAVIPRPLPGPPCFCGLGVCGSVCAGWVCLGLLFSVKSTSPDTENHYKNGYVNIRTSSRPMRTTIMTPSTPSTMTRTITMRATCMSEHSSTPLVVFLVSLIMCHDPLGSSSLSLSSHVIRMSHM